MTNLRDWQKKASERLNVLTKRHNEALRYFENVSFDNVYRNGFKSRDAEIDILIQIIEKQSEAIDSIANGDERFDKVSFKKRARTTQAEVQQIIERLVKDE